MRFSTLRGRLTWLFIGFFLLVSVSAGLTFWSLAAQSEDALLLNLAGRQRMLVQQMTRLAMEWADAAELGTPAVLTEARAMFAQTLQALRQGGDAPYLPAQNTPVPAARQPQIAAQLQQVETAWQAFAAELDRLAVAPPDSPARRAAAAAIAAQSAGLLQEADAAVRLYQDAATRKISRLRTLQIGFLVGALLLLALASWLIRQSVLAPLRHLDQAAEQIGANDLTTPVAVTGPEEIALLSRTLESMRSRLQRSRAELMQLAATLETRVAQRTRELDALNEVSQDISAQLHVQQVLDSVTQKARALLGAEVASLCLLDEGEHWLQLQALSGPDAAIIDDSVPAGQTFVRDILAGAGAQPCTNGQCSGCEMLAPSYRASHLAAPLRRGPRVIGALCVGSPQAGYFTAEAAEILAKLANTAAIALENARLYAQAERVAALEERSRIAAEMHDGLGQTLSYLGLMTDQVVEFLEQGQEAEAVARLHDTRRVIGQATAEARCAIDHLLNDAPGPPDLALRMAAAVEEWGREQGLRVRWLCDIQTAPTCSREIVEQALSVTREALHNVARHAQTQEVSVHLGRLNGHYFVRVEDAGCGFDTAQPEPEGHFGLKIMQARAAHIGGRLTIDSIPGQGTRVQLIWPVAGKG